MSDEDMYVEDEIQMKSDMTSGSRTADRRRQLLEFQIFYGGK